MTSRLKRLVRDTKGATAVEYGLIVSLVVIAMITALSSVAETTSNMWNYVADNVENS